ncbi:4968_t:CDS:2 [Acaulospora morrowiae]|uniref:4968_t:CDS:1 n=1 Tax=Acaulospora morrowiae TaxID=94023 RepID=A0A9N8ZZI0_9GLOM|nr:4968_t:CDS:2 [Acaulospora morrowiae]
MDFSENNYININDSDEEEEIVIDDEADINFVPAWEYPYPSSNRDEAIDNDKDLFSPMQIDVSSNNLSQSSFHPPRECIKDNKGRKKRREIKEDDFVIDDYDSESDREVNFRKVDCNPWTSANWERDIAEIESIEKDPKHGLIVFFAWKSGYKSVEPIKVLNKRAPQKMLDFYEIHLKLV